MTKNRFEDLIVEKGKNSRDIYEQLMTKPAIVLPAGRLSGLVVRKLMDINTEVVAIGDKNPAICIFHRGFFEYKNRKIGIEKTSDLALKWGNSVNYVVYANNYRDEIIRELSGYGIDSNNILGAPVIMGDLVPSDPKERSTFIYQHFKEIDEAANMLSDEESKKELWDILAVFCAKDNIWIEKDTNEEYFNTPYLSLQSNEVFVDAGVYDGETIARFVELCPDYKEIYGIEANPNNIPMIKKRLNRFRDIRIFNNALSNKKGELHFKRNGIGAEGARLSEDGEVIVQGIIGDNMGISPTFIKFDIEGAEYDALLGFKETIKRCKPKMAISVYHNLEDHWRLIKLVKEICPNYKIYLKHHYGYGVMYGTVLYTSI